MRDALSKVWRQSGVNGLFVGWQANLVKDVPFAGIKMSLYEGIKKYIAHFAISLLMKLEIF
jgi:hypothetical protein